MSDSAIPWTVAYQAPSSLGFSRQEYWSGVPFLSLGDLPNPGIEPGSPAFQADALTSEPSRIIMKIKLSLLFSIVSALKSRQLMLGSMLLLLLSRFSRVQLCATPSTKVCQASLSFTISWSLLKFMSIELVTPSNHLVLGHPLLLLPSISPSIRVSPSESALHIRWPKDWSFSFSYGPSNEYSYTKEYYSAMKKDEIMPFAAT